MIKAAFFDIDGTLLSHKSRSVPQSARDALNQLRRKGVLCIAATGRQMSEMEKLPSADLPFDGYITLNGQMILDAQKNLLHAIPVTGRAKEFLLGAFREKRFPVSLVERDRMYANFVDELVQAVHDSLSCAVPPVLPYSGGEIYQVCVYMTDEDKYLLDPIAEDCVMTRWHFGGYDVIAKGGGKTRGIQQYLEILGLRREEIIAFGDGENDVDMLKFAGIGVAMGNGVAMAKDAADYVTSDIDDDGIANALKYFGLI